MFVDRFFGGPLDGQEHPVDNLDEDRRSTPTGEIYDRAPEMDTEEVRAWKHLKYGGTAASGTYVAVQADKGQSLTLGQVSNLIAAAKAQGWDDDASVSALLSWRGALVRLEVPAKK